MMIYGRRYEITRRQDDEPLTTTEKVIAQWVIITVWVIMFAGTAWMTYAATH
jgi:hypothetical protein